jgi:hypothetical protein
MYSGASYAGRTIPTILGICAIALILALIARGQVTTEEKVRGEPSVTTETVQGTVEYVEGNHLVVRMPDGKIREFKVPDSRRFIIDGKEQTVHDLKPGTKLTATVTTTTTPVMARTTTVGSGTVWWVAGNTVIVTLPSGENRTFTVTDDYRFHVNGQADASVQQLRRGMRVSAEKIVEQPITEIVENTVVTGHAPAVHEKH